MSERIAITGAFGQLGTALSRQLGDQAIRWNRQTLDIGEVTLLRATLDRDQPTVVINTAAYNWVDKAESEPEQAYAVNALAARELAMECAKRDIVLVHISTDYVFGGSDAPERGWSETDTPFPASAYAVSKLAGEYFVKSLCPRHFVVRTCGLYGDAESPGKGNFVKTMLRLGRERSPIRVVNDQHCTPTYTHDLAEALLKLVATQEYGLYHATNRSETTWYDFACEIFRLANLPAFVIPIATSQYGAPAQRPYRSVLDCEKLFQTIGGKPRVWREALAEYLSRE